MRCLSVGFQSIPEENKSLFANLLVLEKLSVLVLNKLDLKSIHGYAQVDDGSLYRITKTSLTAEELEEKLAELLPDNVSVVEVTEVDPINEYGYDKGKPVAIGELFNYKAV